MQVDALKLESSYSPIPTIEMFHESSADIRCMVGPVGSGKTTGATWEIFYYLPFHLAEKHGIKKTRWVILRNSYRELADTTQKTVIEWFPWGDLKAGDQVFTLRYPEHGLEVEALFRSCDRPDDLKKFKSLEVTGYWIDESIEVAEDIKRMLKNRIGRFPRKSPVRYGIETTNPPDVEHPTYSNFKWETEVPGPVSTEKPLKSHEGFWQPYNENAANLPDGYYTTLIQDYAGNPDWIDRYVKGMPGVTVQGKAVYHNFIKKLHVAEQPLVWNKSTLFAGWDNSGNCPACIVAQVPTAGVVHILREYHTERMGILDFGHMVLGDRNARFPNAKWIEWGDPAGEAKFSRATGGLTSNAELMRDELGIALKKSEQNWEVRRESVEIQLSRLISGEPAFLIDPSCTRLINGFLGGYCYPEHGTTGIYGNKPIKNKYSHIQDSLQYVMAKLTRQVRAERKSKIKGKSKIINWDRHVRSRGKRDYGEYKEVVVNR